VSDEVEALFLRALNVDQFERPHSVLEWWQDIERAAKSSTPSAVAPKLPEPKPRLVVPEQEKPPSIPGVEPRKWPQRIGWTIFLLLLIGGAAAAAARFAPWPVACPPNMGDCNRRAIDGCETPISNSLANCGACGQACPATNAVSACVNGKCTLQACSEASHKDCNGDPSDGCETDLTTDLAHCGECGRACTNIGAKRAACVNSVCQVACERGRGDCDGKPETGCETTLTTDPNNCGHCGISCRGTACEDGFCAPKLIATVKAADHLAVSSGQVYFYNRDAKQIQRVTAGAEPEVVVDKIGDLVSLAVGAEIVVWSGGKPAGVFAATPGNAAAPTRIAALAKATALVVDASGTFVSWPQRIPVPGLLLPLDKANAVATARLEPALISTPPTPNDCKSAIAAFAGDGEQQICCSPAGPIAALACKGGTCKPEKYSVKCPERLTLDDNWLYWTQDVRVVALDRKSGEIRQVSRRAKPTRELAFGGDYVYWLEGPEAAAEVLRTHRPVKGSAAAPVEVLAKNQSGASSLAADPKGVYWTRTADAGVAIVTLAQ
jgi:hypothetical protein